MNEDSLAEIINGEELVLIGKERAWDYINALDIVTRALYGIVANYFPQISRVRSAREVIEERVVQKYRSKGYADVVLRTTEDKNGNPRDDLLAIYGRREIDRNREAA